MEHKVSTCAPFVPCFHFLTIFDRMTGDRLAFRFYLQNLAFSNLSLTEFQAETIETRKCQPVRAIWLHILGFPTYSPLRLLLQNLDQCYFGEP